MKRFLRAWVLASALLPAARAVGQGVDLPGILMPQAKTLPAPDWLKEGVRLTYYSAAATVPGRDFRHCEVPRGSGHGYTQIDVVALGGRVVLNTRSLGLGPDGSLYPLTTAGWLGAPGAGSDWWVNPKALKDVQPTNTKDLLILPMPYKIGDKAYDTIRFQGSSPNGEQGWNYDLATGILVHGSSSAVSPGGDAVTLGQNDFQGVRQLQIPWANAAPPGWIATVKHFQYEGTHTVTIPGGPPLALPFQVTIDVTDRGKNWLLCSVTRGVSAAPGPPGMPALPALPAVADIVACGPAQIGGLWLPPAAVPGLAAGTTIDKDPFAASEVKVTFRGTLPNGAAAIVIKEDSAGYSTEWTYDATSGVLQATQSENKALHTVVQMHLTQVN